MSAVLILAAVGVLAGLGLGLYGFRWGALVPFGLILAIATAMALRREDFGFSLGVAIILGSLALNQIAYVVGAAILFFSKEPKASQADDHAPDYPGESSESHNVYEHMLFRLSALLAGIWR